MAYAEADSYVRYYDESERSWQYIHLIEKAEPLTYHRRLGSVAPGAILDLTILQELEALEDRHHVYQFMLGVYPDSSVEIWQPQDTRQLAFDRRIENIDVNTTRVITHGQSPYYAPSHCVWVREGFYPGVAVRNLGPTTTVMETIFVGSKFRVEFHDAIPADVMGGLVSGQIASMPITFGGSW